MRIILSITILSLIFCCCSSKKESDQKILSKDTVHKNEVEHTNEVKEFKSKDVPYDTVNLKKGYRLIYSTTDEDRNLHLVGNGIDTIIWSNSIDMLEKYMGYLSADFDRYFVLYSSGGNGLFYMNLFDKVTGKEIVNGIGIKNDTLNEVVFYSSPKSDSLKLIDLKSQKIESFLPPVDIECVQWWNCIDRLKLNPKELTVYYKKTDESEKEVERIKKYVR